MSKVKLTFDRLKRVIQDYGVNINMNGNSPDESGYYSSAYMEMGRSGLQKATIFINYTNASKKTLMIPILAHEFGHHIITSESILDWSDCYGCNTSEKLPVEAVAWDLGFAFINSIFIIKPKFIEYYNKIRDLCFVQYYYNDKRALANAKYNKQIDVANRELNQYRDLVASNFNK